METLLALGAAAGAIASIWGVLAILAKIRTWARVKLNARRERKEAPMKELLSEMREQRKALDNMAERMERMERANQRLDAGMEEIRKKVDRLDDGVATLQGDRLNQAYDFYVDKHNPCPLAVKASLTEMHAQYTGRGYNHLHNSYIERLEECPTE